MAFNHLYVYQFINVSTQCACGKVKLVLITQLPENYSMLISEQVLLYNYPENHNNWATFKYSDVADSNCSTLENAQL